MGLFEDALVGLTKSDTVNEESFAQYIFSRISCSALDARLFDVSENYNHNRTNRIDWYVRKKLTPILCNLGYSDIIFVIFSKVIFLESLGSKS